MYHMYITSNADLKSGKGRDNICPDTLCFIIDFALPPILCRIECISMLQPKSFLSFTFNIICCLGGM